MSKFEWEQDPDERDWLTAQDIHTLRRQAFRNTIAAIAEDYLKDPASAEEFWREMVLSRVWDLAMSVVLGIIQVNEVTDEELDGNNRDDA